MHLLLVSSLLSMGKIEDALKTANAVALDPQKIKNQECVQLAYALAQRSTQQKTNLANQLRFEFLLWLAGTQDIRSALEKLGAKNPKRMLLVSFGPYASLLKKLQAKKQKLRLAQRATWKEMENISLSRI